MQTDFNSIFIKFYQKFSALIIIFSNERDCMWNANANAFSKCKVNQSKTAAPTSRNGDFCTKSAFIAEYLLYDGVLISKMELLVT